MAMKNANNALFWQIDHQIKKSESQEGLVILPSRQAYKELDWTRNLFVDKPKEGYFVWLKKQIDFPLTTCITIASPKTTQNLTNLLVIEKNIKAEANVVCNAAEKSLCATHRAQGRLILKKGASLVYNHFHQWGEEDFVNPDYEFILKENSRLAYNYRSIASPKDLRLKTTIVSQKNSSCNINFVARGLGSKIAIEDTVFLRGVGARGIVKLRLVGGKDSQIKAVSKIVAEKESLGHLDCQGLLINEKAEISLTPQLIVQNKKAQITHEASVGRIAEESLNYLRSRGLTEDEAIDLIAAGFLGEEEPLVIGGRIISSKLYM